MVKKVKYGISKDRNKNRYKKNNKGCLLSEEKKKKYGADFLRFLRGSEETAKASEIKQLILSDDEKKEKNQYTFDIFEVVRERRAEEIARNNAKGNYLCEAEHIITKRYFDMWFRYYCRWREKQ